MATSSRTQPSGVRVTTWCRPMLAGYSWACPCGHDAPVRRGPRGKKSELIPQSCFTSNSPMLSSRLARRSPRLDGLSFLGSMRRERRDGLASPMVELVRSALTGDGAGWKVWLNGMWCCARPPAHALREQGWKLHLAATRSSATAVLQRSLDVLARHRCAFKFAHSLEQVSLLTSRQYPRAGAGKFLTVYSDDDQQLVRLAEEL